MKPTKDHIGLKTAKLLKDCVVKSKYELNSQYWYLCIEDEADAEYPHQVELMEIKEGDPMVKWLGTKCQDSCPAFTWQEILWEHAKEFFGTDLDIESEEKFLKGYSNKSYAKDKYQRIKSCSMPKYRNRAYRIINLLQQKKYEEADAYFRENCILINQNNL